MAHAVRQRIRYRPIYAGTLEAWTVKYAAKNAWRTAPEHDLEDLLQEGRLLFETLREKYPAVIEGAHFTSIYQRSYMNLITDLAWARTRRPDTVSADAPIDAEGNSFTLRAAVTDPGYAAVESDMLLADAPPYINALLQKLVLGPEAGARRAELAARAAGITADTAVAPMAPRMQYRAARTSGGRKRRETNREFVARLCGGADVIDQVLAFFNGSPGAAE